jgi:hypothetical protein
MPGGGVGGIGPPVDGQELRWPAQLVSESINPPTARIMVADASPRWRRRLGMRSSSTPPQSTTPVLPKAPIPRTFLQLTFIGEGMLLGFGADAGAGSPGQLASRPPASVVRAREPDLLPPSGERQSRKRHHAASPVLLHGTLTGNSRQYSGISGVCVERGLWTRLCGGGPSPLRTAIPANREFNREFCRFPCCRRTARPRQIL